MPTKKRKTKDSVHKAAADLHRATREAARARQRLAKLSKPGAPAVLLGSELRAAQAILNARRESLARTPGVVGFGLGRVIENGKPTGEPCITVFVDRKLPKSELRGASRRALPRSFSRNGKKVRVDVAEMGAIRLHAFIGASLGPSNGQQLEGSVGVFAKDIHTGDAVAVTAMHVTGIDNFPNGGPAVQFSVPSLLLHDPNTRAFGTLAFGTRLGVDAAKIILDDPTEGDNNVPTRGLIAGWRPVTNPGDEHLPVWMFGAESGVPNGEPTHGTIVYPAVDIPDLNLADAIIANIHAVNGDSGAALIDQHNHVLGFLVGEPLNGPFKGFQIFCSAASVVQLLDIDF